MCRAYFLAVENKRVSYLLNPQKVHNGSAGIGRPADKHTSHVLPRFTLGTAWEAALDYKTFRSTSGGRFVLWFCSDRAKIELTWFFRGWVCCFMIYLLTAIFGKLSLDSLEPKQRVGVFMMLIFALAICWVSLERMAAKAKERIESGRSRSEEEVFAELDAKGLIILQAHDQDRGISRPRGRPKGAGGFADSDGPLVENMREMITENSAMTVFGAAAQVAHLAAGSASFERKQRRLADRYKEIYGE